MKRRHLTAIFIRMASSDVAGARRMKAWRVHTYGPLSELQLEDARVPPLRAPDELLVRVHYASVNPLDVAMIGGYGSRMLNMLRSLSGVSGAEGVEFPLVCGRDFSGEVVTAGASSRLCAGERVWGVVPPHWPGSHAQYVVVKDRWAGLAPKGLESAGAGGALYAALTACAMLRVGGLAPGRAAPVAPAAPPPRALLLGLGGVGQAALQLLARGAAQTVVGCSGELREQALALGAVEALDRNAPDYQQQLRDAGPFTVVLDCAGLGGAAASGAALGCRFERYVTLTTPLLRETDARGVPAGALAAGAALAAQCASAAAAAARWPPPQVRWAYFVPSADDIELLRRLADRGQFAARVERVFPWREAAAAYERMAAGHARGKILIDFTAGDDTPETSIHR